MAMGDTDKFVMLQDDQAEEDSDAWRLEPFTEEGADLGKALNSEFYLGHARSKCLWDVEGW